MLYHSIISKNGAVTCRRANTLAEAIVARQGFSGRDVKSLLEEKEQIIRKSGILEYTAAVEVVRATGGFSGAELEEVVVNALDEAFASPERELKTEHLLKAAPKIIPLSRSRAGLTRGGPPSRCQPPGTVHNSGPAGRRLASKTLHGEIP